MNITESPADMEGAYRFIRSEHVKASSIAEAGFEVTRSNARVHQTLLALEDTTSLSYSHKSVRSDPGHVNQGNRCRGLLAHSILLFARDKKEGFKRESASVNLASRLAEQMEKVISVCDKEADIYEYLLYKMTHNQRFVVRSMQSLCIEEDKNKLYHYAEELVSAGQKRVHIAQKGGRKARTATLDIVFAPVTLKVPANKKGEALPIYFVGCHERTKHDNGLCWHLMTNEVIENKEDALRIIRYYEQRWLIEEYHKAWKTDGTNVEDVQLQSKDNLERLATINAFIAVRILQLKFAKEQNEDTRCEHVISPTAWKLLWLKSESEKIPST